jgi:Zn finger protein HypA/HybF involved in hydrogenase expression
MRLPDRLKAALQSLSRAERHRRKVDPMPSEAECLACGTESTPSARLFPCEECRGWYCRIGCFTFHAEMAYATD